MASPEQDTIDEAALGLGLAVSQLTPDYRFNPALGTTGRYIDRRGRMVAQQRIIDDLERMVAGTKDEMVAISRQLQSGQISLAEWQLEMRSRIKVVHNAQAAVAKGGWARMTPQDWGKVGSITKRQYAALQRFAIDIETGKQKLTNQFLRRIGMYADASRGTGEDIKRIEADRNELTEERRIRFPGDSCTTCIEQAELGWQPLGTLNRIGDSECLTNCRCIFEFR